MLIRQFQELECPCQQVHSHNSTMLSVTFLLLSALQNAKDWMLILGVASLVAIDLTIIITYILVEGIRGNLGARQVTHRERPSTTEGVSYVAIRYVCKTMTSDIAKPPIANHGIRLRLYFAPLKE